MVDRDRHMGRRQVVKGIAGLGATGILAVGTGGSVRRGPGELETAVSLSVAEEIATKKVRYVARNLPQYSEWADAEVGEPKIYYAPRKNRFRTRYERNAYVFPVVGRTENAGYITISARRNWAPVLEFSKASPPSRAQRRVERAAESKGHDSTGRLLYGGGLGYGVELAENTAIHLGMKTVGSVPDEPHPLSFESDTDAVQSQWQHATDVSTRGPSITESEYINGVPVWDANGGNSDAGNADTSYPGYIGDEADPWDTWDGCVPFAVAQIFMYHENISLSNIEEREAIVDRLHRHMDTDSEGFTKPRKVDNGIDAYDAGQYDYDGNNDRWIRKSTAKTEIDNGRPFMLGIVGDKDDKGGKDYSGHAVASVGYYTNSNGTMYLWVHDSWDDYPHTLQWGNWTTGSILTKITP